MIVLPDPGPALIAPAWVPRAAAVLASPSERPAKGALHLSELNGSTRPYEVVGGVAIIPVCGVIVPQLDWIGWRYGTGCNVLRLQLGMAFDDPAVSAIALLVNSGGGLVNGVADLADWIVEAKAAAGKPVAAILGEYAYSAAYWIASTADTLSVPRTGGLGSVGVIMVHWDYSGMLGTAGVKATIIAAGAHKADGNPYQPLPDDVRASWLVGCEDLRQLFAASVARNRAAAGVALDTGAVLASEACIWDSPSLVAAAVSQGYADAVLPPDQAFQALFDHVNAEERMTLP